MAALGTPTVRLNMFVEISYGLHPSDLEDEE